MKEKTRNGSGRRKRGKEWGICHHRVFVEKTNK